MVRRKYKRQLDLTVTALLGLLLFSQLSKDIIIQLGLLPTLLSDIILCHSLLSAEKPALGRRHLESMWRHWLHHLDEVGYHNTQTYPCSVWIDKELVLFLYKNYLRLSTTLSKISDHRGYRKSTLLVKVMYALYCLFFSRHVEAFLQSRTHLIGPVFLALHISFTYRTTFVGTIFLAL